MYRIAIAAVLALASCNGQSRAPTSDKVDPVSTGKPQTVPAQRDAATSHSVYFTKVVAWKDRMCACRNKECFEQLERQSEDDVNATTAETSLPDEQARLLELGKEWMDCKQRVGAE
jgi:hypothetical protein